MTMQKNHPDNQDYLIAIHVNYKNFSFTIKGNECGEFLNVVNDIQRPIYEFNDKYENIINFAIKYLRGIDNGLDSIVASDIALTEKIYVAAAVYVLQGYDYISNSVMFEEVD